MEELLSYQLTDQVKGQVIYPENPGYDQARKIWNGLFNKRPAMIVQCLSVEDVITTVNFARKNNMLVAIKGGGHNSAGTGSCDSGVMIDLSLLKKISINEKAMTVKVQGGCLWGEVDAALQQFGLAVPCGIISHTGVAGLTLGGGFGWISRKYGLTVDNLLSVEIVTADGRIVYANNSENQDLFWAVRGGGGNFGVVTEFEFSCAKIGTEVYSGAIVKKFEDLKAYVRFHREYVRKLPDEMTAWMVIRHAPPVPFIPQEMHGKLVIIVPFVWLGNPEEGKRLMQPIREITETIGDGSGMHPYTAWQSAFDGLVPHGARNYWKSHQLTNLSDACIDILNDYSLNMPTNECEVFIPHMEGAIKRISADATAFSHRSTPFVLNIHTRWNQPSDDSRCLEWAKNFHDATRSFSQGVYVNFLSSEGEERVKQAYSSETWTKLVNAKNKWDTNNFFRINQNIKPEETSMA